MKNSGVKIGFVLIGIIVTILAGLMASVFIQDCEPFETESGAVEIDLTDFFSSETADPDSEETKETTESQENTEENSTEPVPSETKVTIIDVGQGSAALIESGGEYALIDTGSAARAQVPIAVLKRLGAEKIRLLVNTHWDIDHCSGTIGILKNFETEQFLGAGYEAETRIYQRILEYLEEENLNLEVPKPGDFYTVGSCTVTVIGPENYEDEEENNRSISLILSDGKSRVYFGGDTETAGEMKLIASDTDLDCDIYVCNHHGSSDASSAAFLSALSPEVTIISCGKDNEYGHPAGKTLERIRESGSRLYRTDLQGDIIFCMTESGISFEQEETEDWTPGKTIPSENPAE